VRLSTGVHLSRERHVVDSLEALARSTAKSAFACAIVSCRFVNDAVKVAMIKRHVPAAVT
jgi:hypothetical protein